LGCENGDGTGSTGNTDPKTIVIEGIPDDTEDTNAPNDTAGNGMICVFSDLNDFVNSTPRNAGIGRAVIADGKITVDLTVPSNNTGVSQTKWTGNGSYYVYLMFLGTGTNYSSPRGRIYVGTGGTEPQKYNTDEAITTFSYDDFLKLNVWEK
jgi:hypothetical protein